MRERQKERQRDKENFERVFGQNSYDNLRSFLILAVLGGLIFVIIAAWIWSITENKTEIREVDNIQQQTEELIKLPEQAMPITNQSEWVENIEETYDNMMPEPLDIPERQFGILEDDEIVEIEETELEEEVRPDYSRQKVYDIVDVMPVYPDGEHELMKYIDTHKRP